MQKSKTNTTISYFKPVSLYNLNINLEIVYKLALAIKYISYFGNLAFLIQIL